MEKIKKKFDKEYKLTIFSYGKKIFTTSDLKTGMAQLELNFNNDGVGQITFTIETLTNNALNERVSFAIIDVKLTK